MAVYDMHNVHVNQFSLRQRERAHVSLDADDGPATGWEVPVRASQSDRIEVTSCSRGSDGCLWNSARYLSWPQSRSCATMKSRGFWACLSVP